MLSTKILDLDREIKNLKSAAVRVQGLAKNYPAAENNANMILRHVEMLEVEICDLVTALTTNPKQREEG